MNSHINVGYKIKYKIYDLRSNNKMSDRFYPADVLNEKNSSNIMFFLKIYYTNCLKCKVWLIKTTEETID